MATSSGSESINKSIDPNEPARKPKSSDPGWKYAFWPDLGKRDLVQCTLCGRKLSSGIKRLKQHLAGNYGDVVMCPNVTTEIRREMSTFLNSKQKKKPQFDEMLDDETTDTSRGASNSEFHPSSGTVSKQKKAVSILDFAKPEPKQGKSVAQMIRKSPEEVIKERHEKGPRQTTIESCTITPEMKERVYMHIANFFYENGIAFNAANSLSYEIMIESVGQVGPGLIPPSFHHLRVPLLEKATKDTDKLKEKHQLAWQKYGCSIMSDAWTDRRGRHLINFLANSPEGSFFIGSVNASDKAHDAILLAELLECKIREIGINNVIQVVTDNGSNYKSAGKLLEQRFPGLWWTPCAAHCLNLMMEEIGEIKVFKRVIEDGKRVTTFIHRHGRILDCFRARTRGRDLVRAGPTRFATSFLTLQNLFTFRETLRLLFVSEDWTKSLLSKTQNGQKVHNTVLSTSFWNQVGWNDTSKEHNKKIIRKEAATFEKSNWNY